ncbi:MAG: DUF2092 domain-containing protein [Porphyrobacter sp.]|nr:DUF2092 domain-containing protein [Porphyrobacter sp.]
MRSLVILGGVMTLVMMPAAQAQEQAAQPAASTVAPEDAVDPRAVDALKRMSTYLTSLNTFKLTSTAAMDVITNENQKVQMDSVSVYQVKKPGIAINFSSDMKQRQYLYDGKQFTIFAPAMGYYATVPAPATNREFLKELYDKTGIELPLEDLFRWADDDESDINALTSAFNVGTATIDGARTDHWAFRSADFDWELWIEQGDRPLPRKIVITDRTDPTLPSFTARLAWEVNPTLNPADFTYVPGPGAIPIQIASATGAGQ